MAHYEEKLAEYITMYETALRECDGKGYKGHSGVNALSLYVDDKYDINAAVDNIAHDALCEVAKQL